MEVYAVGVGGTPNPERKTIDQNSDEQITISFKTPNEPQESQKQEGQGITPEPETVFDNQDRILKKTQYNESGEPVGYVIYEYEGDCQKPSIKKVFDENNKLNKTINYTYKDDGSHTEVFQFEDDDKNIFTKTFDSRNRVISITDMSGTAFREYADETAKYPSRTKHYDTKSHLSYITEDKYDSQDRMVEIRFLDPDENLTGTTVNEYDDENGIQTATQMDASGNVEQRSIYDMKKNNRLLEWFYNGDTTKYTYNEDGSYSSVKRNKNNKIIETEEYNTRGQLIEHNENGVKTKCYYDSKDRLSLEKEYQNGKLTTIKYEYNNKDQNIKTITKYPWGVTLTELHKYDANNNKVQDMTYDQNGSFVSGWRYEYDENNKYVGGYSIDANGKRIPESKKDPKQEPKAQESTLQQSTPAKQTIKPLGMKTTSKLSEILPNGAVKRQLTPITKPTYYAPDGTQISEQDYKDYQTGKKKFNGKIDYLMIAQKAGEVELSNGIKIRYKGVSSMAKEKFEFSFNGNPIDRAAFERIMLKHTNPKKAQAIEDMNKQSAEEFNQLLKHGILPEPPQEQIRVPFATEKQLEQYKREERAAEERRKADEFAKRFNLDE